METGNQPLQTLQDIKRIMERSSRFISLSGWSGISAGICAIAGAWLAISRISAFKSSHPSNFEKNESHLIGQVPEVLIPDLVMIASGVFVAAFISAFLFTYMRSKKAGIEIWGNSAMRLLWNTVVPMIVGGTVIIRLLHLKYYSMVAPCCLVFYGLALVNGSKFTLGEVKYLGYGQIILGIINLWLPGYGLIFWTAGFGLLHIIYGTLMWWKYER